ncbi:MAG TPA: hypothetical protein VLV48_06070, partial [Thermoanaerobaculia bacterium]|nr:hypothetical protein [Thermoanaerobaculia bacterium]
MKPRHEAMALAESFQRYANPTDQRELVAEEERHAIGVWISGHDSRGRKLPTYLLPVPHCAWGPSWRETITKLRDLHMKRRQNDALSAGY